MGAAEDRHYRVVEAVRGLGERCADPGGTSPTDPTEMCPMCEACQSDLGASKRLLLEILHEHRPDALPGIALCVHCRTPYPCATTATVARQLGLEDGE